jgi:hypothetical protein
MSNGSICVWEGVKLSKVISKVHVGPMTCIKAIIKEFSKIPTYPCEHTHKGNCKGVFKDANIPRDCNERSQRASDTSKRIV